MSLKLGNSLGKHQSVIRVTWWNLKVISLHIPLQMYKLGQQIKFKQLSEPIITAFNAYGGKKMHRYPTRKKNLPNIQRHQGTIFNKSFLCRGIAGYMLLPVEIQNISSKSMFIKHGRKYLVMNY